MAYVMIALAVLCKETALMLIPSLVALDLLVLRVPWRRLAVRHWPGALIAGLWLVVVRSWLGRSVGAPVRGPWEQLLTQIEAFGYYLRLLVMPVDLNIEPQFTVSSQIGPVVVLTGALGLLLAWVVLRLARGPWLFLAVLAALWALPTSLMPLNVLVNERRAYMLVAVWCMAMGLVRR